MKKIILLSFLGLIVFLGSIQIALAADSYACQCADGSQSKQTACDACVKQCKDAGSSQASCIKVAATTSSGKSSASLPNPLGTTNINTFAATLINNILGFVGTISLLLFIYGGLIWMTSAGAAAKVKQGRDILVWAVIGMAVVFTSYILVKFVIQGVQGVI